MIQNTLCTQLMNDINEVKLSLAQAKLMLLESLTVGNEIEGHLIMKDGQLLLGTKAGIKLPISLCEGEIQLGELLKLQIITKNEEGLVLKTIPQPNIQEAEMPKELLSKEMPTKDMVQKVAEDFKLPKEPGIKQCIDYMLEKQLPLERQDILKTYYLHKSVKLPLPVCVNILEKQGSLKEPLMRLLTEAKESGITTLINQVGTLLREGEFADKDYRKLLEVFDRKNILLPDETSKTLTAKSQGDEIGKGVAIQQKQTIFEMKDMLFKLFEKYTQVSYDELQKIPPQQRGESLQKMAVLEEVITILEQSTLSKESKIEFPIIKETHQQLMQLQNEGEMLLLPFHYKEQVKDVEVYMFKPKKSKSMKKRELYVVVALDMPMLEHLEIHVHQLEKGLTLEVQVAHQKLQKYLAKHMLSLVSQLGELGYDVMSSNVSIKSENLATVIKPEVEQKQILKGFDYKI
ncbi:MAG: hypothetical protein ACRCTE_02930 [Cellulosilyticaceae bacterium]